MYNTYLLRDLRPFLSRKEPMEFDLGTPWLVQPQEKRNKNLDDDLATHDASIITKTYRERNLRNDWCINQDRPYRSLGLVHYTTPLDHHSPTRLLESDAREILALTLCSLRTTTAVPSTGTGKYHRSKWHGRGSPVLTRGTWRYPS